MTKVVRILTSTHKDGKLYILEWYQDLVTRDEGYQISENMKIVKKFKVPCSKAPTDKEAEKIFWEFLRQKDKPENPCETCPYSYVCDHVLSEDCPDTVKQQYPNIWSENGKLKPIQ